MNNPTVAQQIAALNLLQKQATENPDLPAPYITVMAGTYSLAMNVQCSSPSAFELWREALGLPAGAAELRNAGGDDYLSIDQEVSGVQVRLTGYGLSANGIRQRQAEDPHDSPLHTDYAVPHDLPTMPLQRDRRAL